MVNREGAGIVIGMSAFVGVSEDDFGPEAFHDSIKSLGEFRQMQAGFLVRDAELFSADAVEPCHVKRARQFFNASPAVVTEAGESVSAAVLLVTGCTVGHMDQTRTAKASKART